MVRQFGRVVFLMGYPGARYFGGGSGGRYS
jgi:hypothetical protein